MAQEKNNEQVFDSPQEWVRNHIEEYVESDGKKGHQWRGLPTLLLTTRGRKSGKLRRTALIYGQEGNRYLVVASNGGSTKHPFWYLNLVEDPEVMRRQVHRARASRHPRGEAALVASDEPYLSPIR